MPRKKRTEKDIRHDEYVNTKKFWVQIDFDDCVSIHEELQAKQMFQEIEINWFLQKKDFLSLLKM